MKKQGDNWSGIINEGGFDDFSVNGEFHMQKEVPFKNDPDIESGKRLNMAYLLLNNPRIIETMQSSGAHFFNGTNANALPSILKYGLYSGMTSKENGIEVTTGEEWSKFQGERTFVSLSDCLDVALEYATSIKPNENDYTANKLNFGIVFGISLEDMSDLQPIPVRSKFSEVGILDKIPLNCVKFVLVPEDKLAFVQKLVGDRPIEVIPMDIMDLFLRSTVLPMKLHYINPEFQIQNRFLTPIFLKESIKPVVEERRTSGIRAIWEKLRDRIVNIFNVDREEEL